MRDFRIHQIIIKHIGAFEDLNIQLGLKKNNDKADIHILTGENGTGKSTILQAITSISNPSVLTPKVHHFLTNESYFDIRFSFFEIIDKTNGEEMFNTELSMFKFNNGTWQSSIRPKDAISQYLRKWDSFEYEKFDFALFAYSGYRRLDQANVNYVQELTENPLQNSLEIANSINPKTILQWIANTKTKEALAFTKGDLIRAEAYKQSIKRIERVVADITDLHIEFSLADNPLKVQIKLGGIDLDFPLLPDGLKAIISWIADLLMRMERLTWNKEVDIFDRNFILLLDEVDVHLHPAWQRKVLPIIQKLFRNAQIIVSTHSPFITNSVDDAWIYKLKKNGNYSILDGAPTLSENGRSYETILEEIFGIKERFGEEVERDLDNFYDLKKKVLSGELNVNNAEFQRLTMELSSQSIELESIIGMELKQIYKSLKKQN
jgi:predicted ATP-binding protein involved in virulence